MNQGIAVSLVKALVHPPAIVWSIALVLGIGLLFKKKRRSGVAALSVCALLTIFGGTGLPTYLASTLERPYYLTDPLGVPAADAVVVLGGYLGDGAGEAHGFDLRGAADRVFAGMELMKAGKGKALVIGGGGLLGSPTGDLEYDALSSWFERWNFPFPVEHLGRQPDTFREAIAVRSLMKKRGWNSVVLVTSAMHMKRAELIFRDRGIEIVPAACDFVSLPGERRYLIPDIDQLKILHLYLYEQCGRLYYRLRQRVHF